MNKETKTIAITAAVTAAMIAAPWLAVAAAVGYGVAKCSPGLIEKAEGQIINILKKEEK